MALPGGDHEGRCARCRGGKQCAECTYKQNGARWRAASWGLLLPDELGHGSWLEECFTDGQWGLRCKACAAEYKRSASAPAKIRDFVEGTVRLRSALQKSHLRRHSCTKFHKASVAALLGRRTADTATATAPSVADFQRVLAHVVQHGAAPNAGLPEVGRGEKARRMACCLAEACKYFDQKFFKHVQSVALMRDARKGRLHLRFVAVDSNLKVRRGLLGVASNFGTGGQAIHDATSKIMHDFATRYQGTKRELHVPALLRRLRQRTHMITVDAASDELVAAELMRRGLREVLEPLTPNCSTILRDKTHASRRTHPPLTGGTENFHECGVGRLDVSRQLSVCNLVSGWRCFCCERVRAHFDCHEWSRTGCALCSQ